MILRDFIWDFDGTLYDTYPGMVAAFTEAFAENGIVVSEKEVYRKMREGSVGKCFADFFSNVAKELQVQILNEYEKKEIMFTEKARPFDGVFEVCHKIVESGGRNFLLTHRDRQSLNLLKKEGLYSLLTGFVTSEDKFPRKPSPESLLYLCKTYSIDLNKSVMIGDRILDVRAGHNAGIKGYLFDPDNLITEDFVCDKRVTSIWNVLN